MIAGERGDGTIVCRLAFFRKKTTGNLPFGTVIFHALATKTLLTARRSAGAVLQILFLIRTSRHSLFSQNFFYCFDQRHHLLVGSNRDAQTIFGARAVKPADENIQFLKFLKNLLRAGLRRFRPDEVGF